MEFNVPTTANLVIPVLQFWKSFDLDSRRLTLDSQGVEMQGYKETCLKARKKLAENTKVFRKSPDQEKLTIMGPLLKSYQQEIDRLTKRAKFAETSFFTLYKALYEAPDPVSVLETISETQPKNASQTEEIEKLKQEIAEYEGEFLTLKNQDITIRELEEKVKSLQENEEEFVDEEISKRLASLENTFQEKEDALLKREENMRHELEQAQQSLSESQTKVDSLQSDLFDLRQKFEESRTTYQSELELLMEDSQVKESIELENKVLHDKVQRLQLELDESKQEAKNYMDETKRRYSSCTLEDIQQKEAEISRLQLKIADNKQDFLTELDAQKSENNKMSEEIELLKEENNSLTEKLNELPSIEAFREVAEQLKVFQMLEYNVMEDDSSTNRETFKKGSTEDILLGRVRKMDSELKQSSLKLQEKDDELEALKLTNEQQASILEERAILVRQLEEDLANGEKLKGKKAPILSSVLASSPRSSSSFKENVGDENDMKAMMEIVRSQRDRFRDRMKELEEDKQKDQQKCNNLRSAIQRLENDNIQLYQKIRYLQTYQGKHGNKKSSKLSSHDPLMMNSNQLMEEGNVEVKYQRLYEENMNPFSQFHKAERNEQYRNLNTVDKILLNSMKMVMGHKITRTFAFGYILLLHFLVFATLYTYMHACGISNH